MHKKVEDVAGMKLVVAEYDSVGDFARYCATNKHVQTHKRARSHNDDHDWAGGTFADMLEKCKNGDLTYAHKSERLVDQFAHIAIQEVGIDYDYNADYGVVDYHAALSGEIACLYGPTEVETTRAPLYICVDQYVSASVSSTHVERRGVAVLAAAQALTLVRPVVVVFCTALRHEKSRTDTVQIMPVPTAPMDLSRASYMLGSTSIFRQGMLTAIYGVIDRDYDNDMLGPLSNDSFHERELGDWLGKRIGANETVFLPRVYRDKDFTNDEEVEKWVIKTVNQYA